MTTEAKEMKPFDWLYVGFDWDGKKLMHRWDDDFGHMHHFATNITQARPGAYFRIHTDGEMVRTGNDDKGPKYLRMVEDQRKLGEMQSRSKCCQAEARMDKDHKDQMKVDVLDKALAPLSVEYHGRNQVGRAALIAEAILRLQGWR